MKIKAGSTNVRVPPIGMLASVLYRGIGAHAVVMKQVCDADYDRIQEGADAVRGAPVYCCLRGRQLFVFPWPVANGEITIHYYPPMRKA